MKPAVLIANDGTAGGAVQALTEEGVAGKVLVTGQDAELAALQRIAAGTQTMTIYKPLKELTNNAATAAVKLAKRQVVVARSSVNNGKLDVPAILSETTSNTASANMVVPVVIAIGRASGLDPLEAALGATFGASLGFMLPVSTPCNAIVYGSGYIPLGRMLRWGLALDLVGVVVIIALVRLLSPLVR